MKPNGCTEISVGERLTMVRTPTAPFGRSALKQHAVGTSNQYRFSSRPIESKICNKFQKDMSRGTYSNPMVNKTHSNADASLNAEIDCDAIEQLRGQYKFREPTKVESFLVGNNTLRKMLFTIYSKIRKEFPSEKITLEVFSDSPRSSEKDMVVSVETSLPVDEAIEKLDKVEDVSWNKGSSDPYVNICVKLEYQ